MVGKKCLWLLVLLTLVCVCAVVAPASSGEHPWDADNQLSGKTGPGAELLDPIRDTVIGVHPNDSNVVTPPTHPSFSSGSALVDITAAILRLCFNLL